ncbi:OmpA family protein [Candidatus Poribacteria bacterium]|nr:OmpA family protein [Candidatus Poribacteria bacterium]MYA70910.1 OmpA family protein [Candidatus Poribacteria bacterium]MYH84192.1 OmpA family protein [Candidatus Poribacteria bacterium]MYK94664.1 OmpA family protein [Candidatus Poribacteria bacterium]
MKFYGSLLLCTYLLVFGCAKPEIDEVMLATQFQDAQQAINNAAELEAESLVPEEYGRAVKLMNFARDSREKTDIPQSMEFAYQAEWVAQIAIAKARQHRAKQKIVSIREQIYQQVIKAHEHELEIGRIRQAITEEQLARALRAGDKGQQLTEQFSAEIADLKIKLRQAELRAPIVGLEGLVTITQDIYPAIKETADYERVQAAIASITNLIAQEAFSDAENATTDARTRVNDLYLLAVRNREAEVEAKTNAQIAIAQAEVIIQRAQILNASQHAPQQLQEASSHLQRAKQGLDTHRYEQAQQSAQQAQQSAGKAVATAEVTEYRQRAQQELNTLIARARRAVTGLGEKIAAQTKTQVPQLEAKLYELANAAYEKSQSAFAAKEYDNAINAAAEGDDYLQRAIANARQLTSAKSDLLLASKQVPNAIVTEQKESVLIRISGNAFAYGSEHIQAEFVDTFAQLAKVLRTAGFSKYPVRIEVHTSSLGDAKGNQNVSMRRADSIKRFLTTDGRVDAARITAVGLGETQPIVKDGPNKEEKNRRIDVIIKTN